MKIKLINRSTFYYKTFLQELLFCVMLVFCGFFLSVTALGQQTDPTPDVVDDDNDGLIEIYNIEQLNAIRFNRTGTGYTESEGASTVSTGCPPAGCNGYELVRDLDFAETSSYASGTVNTKFRPTGGEPATATNAGFVPIGYHTSATDSAPFNAFFEGNGFAIRHLYVNTIKYSAGLFGINFGRISSLGVIDGYVKGTTAVGGLVGLNVGLILNSQVIDGYVKGTLAGGLVGRNSGFIVSCHATGGITVATENNDLLNAGGLVGVQITPASENTLGILNSYATGEVIATETNNDVPSDVPNGNAGGLVGAATIGLISDCYATGKVTANNDAGGLVGQIQDTAVISNCYATGNASAPEFAGGLIGFYFAGTVSASYWNETTSGVNRKVGRTLTTNFTGNTDEIIGLSTSEMEALTAISTTWSTNDWDFGSISQYPALRSYEVDNNVPPNQIQGKLLCDQPGSRAQCPPALKLISTSITGDTSDFGDVAITVSPAEFTYTLLGEHLMSDITLESTGDGFTTMVTDGTLTLSSDGKVSAVITVTFDPTAVKTYTGMITHSGGGLADNLVLTLNGSGVIANPRLAIDATLPTEITENPTNTFNFGGVLVTDPVHTFKYTLTGQDLHDDITLEKIGDGFTISPVIVQTQAGGVLSAEITVSFNPTAVQTYTGMITHSGGGLAENLVVTLNGTTILEVLEDTTSSIRLFPNPVANDLYVQGNGVMQVTVRGLTGKLHGSYEITDIGKVPFDILPAGLYIVRIKSSADVLTQRVMKKPKL